MPHLSKENLKSYLSNRWDVRMEVMQADWKLAPEDQSGLSDLLSDLVEEGWIIKSYCKTHQAEEYDPGPSQEQIKSRQ
jgi:hypothetical protein